MKNKDLEQMVNMIAETRNGDLLSDYKKYLNKERDGMRNELKRYLILISEDVEISEEVKTIKDEEIIELTNMLKERIKNILKKGNVPKYMEYNYTKFLYS